MATLRSKLDSHIGLSIDKICPNKFHNFNSSHCAHFVGHMLELDFSFNCRQYKGGEKKTANIRVQEIFPRCPKVGKFEDAPSGKPILAFVTKKTAVNLAKKKITNISQKHIGIAVGNHIYHYSNSQNRVVKWTVRKFLDTFEKAYAGKQGLFYGTIPGSDLNLNIDPMGGDVSRGIAFKLDRDDSKRWHATALNSIDGTRFYVGRETKYAGKYFGVFQRNSEYYGPRFDPTKYVSRIDHWAYLLGITGYCESENHFNLFNTYDRAKFTYGFYQLAAHTPKDNLILFFRELVGRAKAKDYFPELKLIDGRVHRIDGDGGVTNLERKMNTGPNGSIQLQLFMNYLNPFRKAVEEQEVLNVARLMHWTANDPVFRRLQVEVGHEILQGKMAHRYHKWYDLDGKPDTICAIIADIHHQGRARRKAVEKALKKSNPEKALIEVAPKYTNRINNLRFIVSKYKSEGRLGVKTYDAGNNEFV